MPSAIRGPAPFPCLKRHPAVMDGQAVRCRPATRQELDAILAALHD